MRSSIIKQEDNKMLKGITAFLFIVILLSSNILLHGKEGFTSVKLENYIVEAEGNDSGLSRYEPAGTKWKVIQIETDRLGIVSGNKTLSSGYGSGTGPGTGAKLT
jgi:hypothetical protein